MTNDFFGSGLGAQLRQNAVLTSAGKFEVHPEAYNPRIFIKTEHGSAKVYELLMDGQAVIWPTTPNADVIGDFWLVHAGSVTDLKMVRRVHD